MKLSHHDGPVRTLDVGHYCDDGGVIVVRCGCGGISHLDGHQVSASGRVSPIWNCPFPSCPETGFLQLVQP